MKTQITIWTLAFDTDEGLGCKLFHSEEEIYRFMEGKMLTSMEGVVEESANEIRQLIQTGDFDSAYCQWMDYYREDLDSYAWDFCTFELPAEIEVSKTTQV
jgi:hypothetical protein